MRAVILDKIPSKINLNDEETLFGPFSSTEDIDYFVEGLAKDISKDKISITDMEPTEFYWLLLIKVNI
jgi:hypothetical protein